MEVREAGAKSKTDIAICYLKGKADEKTVDDLRQRIDKIEVNTLNMSQESVIECLVRKQKWNPFPKVRYTERSLWSILQVARGNSHLNHIAGCSIIIGLRILLRP